MIDSRVIELLKSPQQIQAQDLKLVSNEIGKYPYVQSLRALYLLGTHLYDKDQYQAVLHTTAAYTTDKKILYHFINTESKQKPSEVAPALSQQSPEQSAIPSPYQTVLPKEKRVLAVVHVNGLRNRILFEGEEDFLLQESPKIDWEQTQESGKVSSFSVPDPAPLPLVAPPEQTEPEIPAKETTQHEATTASDPKPLSVPILAEESSSDLSFQDVDSFLPQVAMPVKAKANTFLPKQSSDRHQDEMQKLIAEVEAKIKAKKDSGQKDNRIEEPELVQDSGKINFSQVSDFDITSTSPKEESAPKELPREEAQSSSLPSETSVKEQQLEQSSSKATAPWKPMEIPGLQKPKRDHLVVENRPIEPVFKTSEPLVTGESKRSTPKQVLDSKPLENPESNVPGFINTWQSWLKIDRSKEELSSAQPLLSIDQVRNKAIETFIETQPKISRLKEESSFAIKEKPDDISHLMTETLVGLYVEQRLYAKAIEGYEVLQVKYPEKFKEYSEKIEQVKLRK